jgi:predicted nucleotidyltransferase
MQRPHHLDPAERDAVVCALRDELAASPDIAFAYLFGSFVGEAAFRDVDVAIWTTAEAPRLLDVELATRLSSRIGLPVDVRRVNDAPVPFLFKVLRGRLLVSRDDRLLADLIERTARAYHDIAPLLRRATREAFAA